ncbi:MAG TPA: hypothetical protein VMY76_09750 [Gemmatimonadales bacterium]|nr:hypothetical protein [Gemmatimonadales bacterium]
MLNQFTALAALAVWSAKLEAQIGLTSATAAVALSATKAASVSVSLPGGNSATLPGTLVTGPNDFTPISVSTAWDVEPDRTGSVALVAFFDQPTHALVGPAAVIPSAAVYGRVPTGGPKSFASFTGGPVVTGPVAAGSAGGTLVLFTQQISGTNALGGRSDDLQMRIDLTDSPELPAAQYAGTLNLLVITQ